MEKELQQADSMSTVTINKPDYPPSEIYTSEPPPAYPRSQSSSVQVAKIIGATIVVVSFVLGGFILASAYITANSSCRQLEQELEILSEAADRFQPLPLQPEALVQKREPVEPLETDESKIISKNQVDADDDSSSSSDSESDEADEKQPIRFNLPLQLDFDELAGNLIEKNLKARMNCVVEKKRAEQIMDPTLRLPFGINLTNPKYQKISGEKMAIFCESGSSMQKGSPQEERNDSNDDDDDEEDTVMIQPVMIPIPSSRFPTHMAQQMPAQPPAHGNSFPPLAFLHQIAQQIITQRIMEEQKARAQQQQPDPENNSYDEGMPISEEILSQLNRLPNRDNVIIAVQQHQPQMPEEQSNGENEANGVWRMMPQPMANAERQQPNGALEMGARPSYGRVMPLQMVQQEEEASNAQGETPKEAPLAHVLRPRSVRSVDAVFEKKRVKRCSCDCNC